MRAGNAGGRGAEAAWRRRSSPRLSKPAHCPVTDTAPTRESAALSRPKREVDQFPAERARFRAEWRIARRLGRELHVLAEGRRVGPEEPADAVVTVVQFGSMAPEWVGGECYRTPW